MEYLAPLIIFGSILVGAIIGANDCGNAIGPVVGSRITGFKKAAILVGLLAVLGAILQGQNISHTVGSQIIPAQIMEDNQLAVFAALITVAAFILALTVIGLPVSINQALVGAVAGIGVAVGSSASISRHTLAKIMASWAAAPVIAAVLAIIIYRTVITYLAPRLSIQSFAPTFRILTMLAALFLAYDLGANDVGNLMGPLIGSKALATLMEGSSEHLAAAVLLGVSLGVGAYFWGRRVSDTLGRGITRLCPASAFCAHLSSALTIYFFILLGIPVSTTQAMVGGILGVGLNKGAVTVNTKMLQIIAAGWVLTPITAAAGSVLVYNILAAVV